VVALIDLTDGATERAPPGRIVTRASGGVNDAWWARRDRKKRRVTH